MFTEMSLKELHGTNFSSAFRVQDNSTPPTENHRLNTERTRDLHNSNPEKSTFL